MLKQKKTYRRIAFLLALIMLFPSTVFAASFKPVVPDKIEGIQVRQDGKYVSFQWEPVKYAVSYNIYTTIIDENGQSKDYLVDTTLEDSYGMALSMFEEDQSMPSDYWQHYLIWPKNTEYITIVPVTALNKEGPKSDTIEITAATDKYIPDDVLEDGYIEELEKYISIDDVKYIVKNNSQASEEKELTLRNEKATMRSLTLTWSKVQDAQSYTVYRSISKNRGYRSIGTTKNTRFISKGLNKNKTYYYKVSANKSDGTKTVSNVTKKIKVKGNYKLGSSYGPYLTQTQLNKVGDAVANFVNTKIDDNMSAMDKAAYAHHYLAGWCYYGTSKNYNDAYGALITRVAQCSGYTRAYKALCEAMGISCKHVYAKNGEHQFNIVKLNATNYIVDVQLDSLSHVKVGLFRSTKAYKSFVSYSTSKYPQCPKSYFSERYYEESGYIRNLTYYDKIVWW